MSASYRRTLPARPDLDQQKKLAKDLLRAFRAGDPDATARMRAELPDKAELSLTDAQYVLVGGTRRFEGRPADIEDELRHLIAVLEA